MRVQSLRSSQQFQIVYKHGKRYNARNITVFVAPNGLKFDRFGLTASRKTAKLAVDRNRMKRLLREAIYIAVEKHFGHKTRCFDWVINAKRSMLSVKLPGICSDLEQVVISVCGECYNEIGGGDA